MCGVISVHSHKCRRRRLRKALGRLSLFAHRSDGGFSGLGICTGDGLLVGGRLRGDGILDHILLDGRDGSCGLGSPLKSPLRHDLLLKSSDVKESSSSSSSESLEWFVVRWRRPRPRSCFPCAFFLSNDVRAFDSFFFGTFNHDMELWQTAIERGIVVAWDESTAAKAGFATFSHAAVADLEVGPFFPVFGREPVVFLVGPLEDMLACG